MSQEPFNCSFIINYLLFKIQRDKTLHYLLSTPSLYLGILKREAVWGNQCLEIIPRSRKNSINQGRTGAAITHSTSRLQCTAPIQLALGSTDFPSWKESSLHSTSPPWPCFPRAVSTAELFYWIHSSLGLLWYKDLSLSLALLCRSANQLDEERKSRYTGRQGAFQSSFMGSPVSLGQQWSWVAMDICALHKCVILS